MSKWFKSDARYLRRSDQGAGPDEAWTQASILATSGSGALANAGGTMWYKRIGSTVFVEFTMSITNFGTAAQPGFSNLPYTVKRFGMKGGARENSVVGSTWQCLCYAGTKSMLMLRYDNSDVIADGYSFEGAFTYETSDLP